MQSSSQPRRLWIKAGEYREIVMVDDDPLCVHEHNPKMNNRWDNWFTCLQGIADSAPCCEILGANTRYYVGYVTVVDCSLYVDKKGNKHQYELKLLPAKLKTLKKFKRKREDRGSLVGAVFKATREDAKSPSVGDEFEYMRQADMDKLFELTTFHGRKLTELYSAAMENPASLSTLKNIFQVSMDGGKPIPKLNPFNYFEILKPKSPDEIRAMLKGATFDDAPGPTSGESSVDDIPF